MWRAFSQRKPPLPRSKKRKEHHLTRYRAAIAASLLVSILALGCARKKDADDEEKTAAPVPEVTTVKVEKGNIADEITVSGNLAALPNKDAKVAALVPGRIAEVLVSEGDAVKAGQPLARLDNTPLMDQEKQAEATLAQAKANNDNAKLSAKRNEDLLGRGIAARKEVEDARTQVAVSEAALQQAQAALATARTQVSRSTLRAPFAGTVVKRFLGVGDQVDGTGAQPVVEVANIDALELLGTVPAARLNDVKAGEQFQIDSPSVPGKDIVAKIVAVLPAVDPATNTGTIRIRIENPKHDVKLGMFLSVTLPMKRSVAKLIVPRQAIYPDESGEPHVYRLNGEDAESVGVELGAQTKDKVEIVSGVKEGDTLILTGGYGLPEKAKVKVKAGKAEKAE
jgi:RND family efflux transporter MFP subunit